MQFVGHNGRIMCIDWFHNDMGFPTCGVDGNIYFYNLYKGNDQGVRDLDRDISFKRAKFTSVVNLPGPPYNILAVGSEKTIYTETESMKVIPRPTPENPNPQPQLPELKHHLAQLVIHHSGKILFAGVGDMGETNFPGAIQVWKLPFEKAAEIQAHASPITRLRITHTNTHLFSVGVDGMLAIFDVKDRDPKRDPEGITLRFSQEILSEKAEVETLMAEEDQLATKNQNQKEADMEVDIQLNVKSQQSTIAEKKNQLISQRQQAENKKQSLLRQIEESKNTKEVERRKLLDRQQEKIEQKRNKYSKRMLDDAKEFSKLQALKEREHQTYLAAIEKIK